MVKVVFLSLLVSFSAFADDVIGEYSGSLNLSVSRNTPGSPAETFNGVCAVGYNFSYDGTRFDNDIASINCGNYGMFNETLHLIGVDGKAYLAKNGSPDFARGAVGIMTANDVTARLVSEKEISYTETGCEGRAQKVVKSQRIVTYRYQPGKGNWHVTRLVEVMAPIYREHWMQCEDGHRIRFRGYEVAHDTYSLQGFVYKQ